MYTVPPSFVPKFRRLDKIFPLSGFKVFLAERGLTPLVVVQYTSSIRQLLGAIGESQPGEGGAVQRSTWRDFERVQAYAEELPVRRRTVTQCAWRHWCAFTKNVDPLRMSLSYLEQQAVVVAALHTLLAYGGAPGVPPLQRKDIPKLRWEKTWRDEFWYLTPNLRGETRWVLPPGLRVIGDILREWGYPKGCPSGAPFVPKEQGSMEPMSTSTLTEALDNVVPTHVAKWLNDAIALEFKTMKATIAVAPITVPVEAVALPAAPKSKSHEPAAARTVDTSAESFGKTTIVNGKIVVEHPEDDGMDDELPD